MLFPLVARETLNTKIGKVTLSESKDGWWVIEHGPAQPEHGRRHMHWQTGFWSKAEALAALRIRETTGRFPK